jgi:hypothetical protein
MIVRDATPTLRHVIDGKSSYVPNTALPKQLADFFRFTGSQTGTVITPTGSFGIKAPPTVRRP